MKTLSISTHYREHPYARLGRLCGQQDVLRAEPADADDRRAAGRDLDAQRHPFRRRHARDRRAHRRHGVAADGLSGQPRRRRRSQRPGVGLVGDHAGDDREVGRRYPRRRYFDPAHRLAPLLRRAEPAGPGALFLLPPQRVWTLETLECMLEEKDQMVRHGHYGSCTTISDEHLDPQHAPDIAAREFEEKLGKKPADYFRHLLAAGIRRAQAPSARKVRQDMFPFHNYACSRKVCCTPRISAAISRPCSASPACIIGALPVAL